MDITKITSPMPVASRQLNQLQNVIPGRPSTSMPSTSSSEPCMEYKVRVPRNLAKKYYMMRFQSGKPDLSSITKVSMSRDKVSNVSKEEEALPKSGAGSEYGRERREEARKRRRGYVKRAVDPDTAPWNLKIGGKGGRRYSGKKEAGINDNSSYYILTQCPDGAFEAVPVTSWYNFTPNINYRTLTSDEAEEEFLRRDRTVNFFSLMVKKRLQNNEEGEEQEKDKGSSGSRKMKLYDGDDLEMSDDDDDDEPGQDEKSKIKSDKPNKERKGKPKTKTKSKTKKGTDEESDASSEEDGYFDSKEVDYMSDSSSSSEEEKEKQDTVKPDTKDDLNAESSESDSEDDDELTNAGKDIKKMLQKDQGEGGSSDEEDEDPENEDDVKGTAAMLLQDKGKGKKKSGSRSSTSSSSRSSTPTKGTETQIANSTIQAAAKRLEGRPGTPTGKGKKRPASEPIKTGFVSISDSRSSKKARVSSPASNSQSGSACNTPTPSENGNAITEDSVRRYLARKPMTTKDLLQKFKSKKTGLTNEQTVQLIATILKKIQPEQNKIKGKLYLSLKST